MTYKLHIGNKRYSSWSMRPWVLLKALGIPFDEELYFFKPGFRQPEFFAFSSSGKVPCLHDGDTVVWDSLAIVEYLADRHDGVWPSKEDAAARAFARCAAAEMHSSFGAIRSECGMNVGLRFEMRRPLSDDLQRDISRLNQLFKEGVERFGGPWLAGSKFTAVDAFFAPVAARIKGYGLELESEAAREYVERLLGQPGVQEWVQAGIREKAREPNHEEESGRDGLTILEDFSAKV